MNIVTDCHWAWRICLNHQMSLHKECDVWVCRWCNYHEALAGGDRCDCGWTKPVGPDYLYNLYLDLAIWGKGSRFIDKPTSIKR
mgnify:CR=1